MQIGALSFRPYIYNTNTLGAASMSSISPIDEDLLSSKTDYSSLTDESLNENPLRKGETGNFMDVLAMQMQMGRMNASRLMVQLEETSSSEEDFLQNMDQLQDDLMQEAVGTKDAETIAFELTEDVGNLTMDGAVADMPEETFNMREDAAQISEMLFQRNLFQMQRAAMAYQTGGFFM